MRSANVWATARILVVGLAVGLAGCGSNNDGGKLVGKWKVESANTKEAKELAEMKEMGVFMYFEFKADKTFAFGFDADKKENLDMLKMGMKMQGMGDSVVFPGKYSLGSGDNVVFTDFKGPDGKGFGGKEKGQSKVKVTGDSMTITDAEGTMTLSRTK